MKMISRARLKVKEHIRRCVEPLVLRALSFRAPAMKLDTHKRKAFERIYRRDIQGGTGGVVSYDCPYPKHEFLRYLVRTKPVLLHGSRHPDIELLEPRDQGDFEDKPVKAVFASGDGIWPMFFAIVNWAGYKGSIRNGCSVVGGRRGRSSRFYHFSVNREVEQPWTMGTIYILPRETFRRSDPRPIYMDEWLSEVPVRILAKLPVVPEDFPFLGRVALHDERESGRTSELLYKLRVLTGRRAGWSVPGR